MPLTLQEYETLLNARMKELNESLLQRSTSSEQAEIRTEYWTPLPGNSIFREKLIGILCDYARFFSEDKNAPGWFYKEGWRLRKLECRYLRLLYIDAAKSHFDNDLVEGVSLMTSQAPSVGSILAVEQCTFQMRLSDLMLEYYRREMPGQPYFADPKYAELLSASEHDTLQKERQKAITFGASFNVQVGGDKVPLNQALFNAKESEKKISEVSVVISRVVRDEKIKNEMLIKTVESLNVTIRNLNERIERLERQSQRGAGEDSEDESEGELHTVDLLSSSSSTVGKNRNTFYGKSGKANGDEKEQQTPLLSVNDSKFGVSVNKGEK